MLTGPVRVAVLSTTRAPGIDDLLERHCVAAFVATDPGHRDLARVVAAGVPATVHDLHAFYSAAGKPVRDLGVRHRFDRKTVALLAECRPDLIITCGYLYIVTGPLLEAYPGRVVNVHDSDLPAYPGLHAVRDAVIAGEQATRSVVHLVTAGVDAGPVLVRSWGFPTHPMIRDAHRWGAIDILKAYAYAQREWMMRAAWGRLMDEAIRCYADGAASFGGRVPRTLSPPEPSLAWTGKAAAEAAGVA